MTSLVRTWAIRTTIITEKLTEICTNVRNEQKESGTEELIHRNLFERNTQFIDREREVGRKIYFRQGANGDEK